MTRFQEKSIMVTCNQVTWIIFLGPIQSLLSTPIWSISSLFSQNTDPETYFLDCVELINGLICSVISQCHSYFTDPPLLNSQHRDTLYYYLVNKSETFSIPQLFPQSVLLNHSHDINKHSPGQELLVVSLFSHQKLTHCEEKGMYSLKKKSPSTATHSKRHTRELDQFVVCNKQATSSEL